MKNILIVDDHAVMRSGLKSLLIDSYQGLRIFETGDADAMLEQFKKTSIDLLIMDLHMPNTDSIGLVELISIKYPRTYILIFSMLPEHIYGRRILKAGAKGYLPKESTITEIREAFTQVMKDRAYLSQKLSELIAYQVPENKDSNPFSRLSHREFEITNFLLAGMNIVAIAQKLNVKPSTIGTYKTRIFDKLQVQTLFELKEMALLFDFNHHRLNY